ncbi:sugar transferase [Agromyces sp. NPDC058484]|uniref:sugar transferase n=1 Tax=Agromyces sp. NPDC058484 TaxID=3346524 RepID=UPI0036476417
MSVLSGRHPRATRSRRLRLVPDVAVDPQLGDARESGARWARRYRVRLELTDTAIIAASVLASLGSSAWSPTGGALGIPLGDAAVPFVILGVWLLALAAYHTRDARVLGVGATEYKLVVNASALAFGMTAILFLVLQVDLARGYFLLALPLGLIALVLGRWLWRKWLLHQRAFGHYLTRAIVVGRRDDVEYVIAQIARSSGAAYRIVGAAVDDAAAGTVTAGGLRVQVICEMSDVAEAAAAADADCVIVAGQPTEGGEFVRKLGWDLEGTAAELVLSSRLADVAGPRIHFRPVDGLPLIHVETPRFEGGKHVLKRSMDVMLTSIALVVLMPLMLAIAVLIKLDSPGPVLFRQQRCGRSGQAFQMLKFRSMVQTAEDDLAGLLDRNEGSGVLFKMRNDPRVTRIGRKLRKYSLDELPQIWNALVGDMSIVGPRPPLVTEVECYDGAVHRRLYIKPGITGLWQISGRSDLTWEDSVRLDLYYVENWSLTGDLMIIWRTFKTLLKPVGAY